jgi:hypothetical protein
MLRLNNNEKKKFARQFSSFCHNSLVFSLFCKTIFIFKRLTIAPYFNLHIFHYASPRPTERMCIAPARVVHGREGMRRKINVYENFARA